MGVIIRDCPHCPAASVTFRCDASLRLGEDHSGNRLYNALFSCAACRGPLTAFMMTKKIFDLPPEDARVANCEDIFNVGTTFPSRTPPKAPPDVPRVIAGKYLQGERAFERGDWDAAAGMYRSAIDLSTKASMPSETSRTLYNRIEIMRDRHVIPAAMSEWAHEIRVIANDGLHEEELLLEKADAVSARLFAELFLRYTYELPAEVSRRRDAKLQK